MKKLRKSPVCPLLIYIPITFVALSIAIVLVMRYLPVTVTPLMVKRQLQFSGDTSFTTKRCWKELSQIPKDVVGVIVMSEDSRFRQHHGVDLIELRHMLAAFRNGDGKLRGCSTISQQVAKNCFTLCTDSWLRKIPELYWTGLIELFWGKDRILEVYLNVAEMGYGIYGIEAASQTYYHCPAKQLTIHEAAELAACMPLPLERTPLTIWNKAPDKIRKILAKVYKNH